MKPSSSRDVSAEAIASLASGKRAADHSGIRSSSTISSCKKRSAVLQLLDQTSAKRQLVAESASRLPWQARTVSMTGQGQASGYKERGRKRSDLTIEDCKDAVTKVARIRHSKASPDMLDEGWVELVRKHKYSDTDGEAQAEAEAQADAH